MIGNQKKCYTPTCWMYGVQVLDKYNQGIEARNRMLELILPGKVVFLRPRKVIITKITGLPVTAMYQLGVP